MVLFTLLTSTTCEPTVEYPYKQSLSVDNHSDFKLRVYIQTASGNGVEYEVETIYPDTLLPLRREELVYLEDGLTLVPPHLNKICDEILGTQDAKTFLHTHLTCDTMSVFIVHHDTLEKYGYQDVRLNNRLLVRYDLSIDEVDEMNYTFRYPPDESMKDVKMWPSYNEVINFKSETH